jgi:hypothetical protein
LDLLHFDNFLSAGVAVGFLSKTVVRDHHVLAILDGHVIRSVNSYRLVSGNAIVHGREDSAGLHHGHGLHLDGRLHHGHFHFAWDLLGDEMLTALSVGRLHGHAFVVVLGDLSLSGFSGELHGLFRSAAAGGLATPAADSADAGAGFLVAAARAGDEGALLNMLGDRVHSCPHFLSVVGSGLLGDDRDGPLLSLIHGFLLFDRYHHSNLFLLLDRVHHSRLNLPGCGGPGSLDLLLVAILLGHSGGADVHFGDSRLRHAAGLRAAAVASGDGGHSAARGLEVLRLGKGRQAGNSKDLETT